MAEHVVRPPPVDKADEHVAKAARYKKIFEAKKNAQPGRWIGGWPLFPVYSGPGVPTATPIATALAPLAANNVDLFQQAVNAQQNQNVVGSPGAGYLQGQAPWNNFLGTNTRPMFVMFPNAGGIYIGNLWDMVSGQPGAAAPMSGFYSSLIENTIVQIQIGQQPTVYVPLLSMPAGTRMDRRVTSTSDNVLTTTEGFGPLNSEGIREMPEYSCWDQDSQIQFLLQPTQSLKLFIGTLTTEFIPMSGSLIAWFGYGTEERGLGTLM